MEIIDSTTDKQQTLELLANAPPLELSTEHRMAIIATNDPDIAHAYWEASLREATALVRQKTS